MPRADDSLVCASGAAQPHWLVVRASARIFVPEGEYGLKVTRCQWHPAHVQYHIGMDPDARMREALDLARAAVAAGEVPIGAIVVHDPTGRVVGRGFNRR